MDESVNPTSYIDCGKSDDPSKRPDILTRPSQLSTHPYLPSPDRNLGWPDLSNVPRRTIYSSLIFRGPASRCEFRIHSEVNARPQLYCSLLTVLSTRISQKTQSQTSLKIIGRPNGPIDTMYNYWATRYEALLWTPARASEVHYILLMFFLWPPYSPALVNGGS